MTPAIQHLRNVVNNFSNGFKTHFHQFGIPVIVAHINGNPLLKIQIDLLVNKYEHLNIKDKIEEVCSSGSKSIGEVMPPLTTDPDIYVAFCWHWLERAVQSGNGNQSLTRWQGDDNAHNFVAGCIEPIVAYLEKADLQTLNGVLKLERYRIFTERYDVIMESSKEEELTKKHLARFLFAEGYTYVLSEILSSSGRIDNLAGLPVENDPDLAKRDDAILIEAKIAKRISDITAVFEQLKKRLDDLGLAVGYAIVYCKNKLPRYEDADGSVVFPYYQIAGKRIFFVNVRMNLNEKI